jgi:hypothetical protein
MWSILDTKPNENVVNSMKYDVNSVAGHLWLPREHVMAYRKTPARTTICVRGWRGSWLGEYEGRTCVIDVSYLCPHQRAFPDTVWHMNNIRQDVTARRVSLRRDGRSLRGHRRSSTIPAARFRVRKERDTSGLGAKLRIHVAQSDVLFGNFYSATCFHTYDKR